MREAESTDLMTYESANEGQETTAPSANLAAAGAVVGGIAALSCCVMPLVFVIVGISGAWIAYLTALSPYQPVFFALALGSIGYGHYALHRARRACEAGNACATPLPNRLVQTSLWAGTIFVVIAFAANYAAPFLV